MPGPLAPLRAFALTAALVLSGFLVAPYLATYLAVIVGLRQDERVK